VKKSKILLGILVMTLVAACAKQPTRTTELTASTQTSPAPSSEKISSEKVVKAITPNVTINAGQSANATVQLNINSGYHVNANPPSYPYLKATEVEFPTADGISVGFIVYPDGKTKKFAFAEKPLSIYEGQSVIKVNLKANDKAVKGSRNLSGKLRVQACDEQVCYAPGVIDLRIPVTIK
jgi:hypothetical protein